MPQLDSTWYISQFFWLIISFIAMFIVVWKFIMPLCKATVDYRQSILDKNLKDAEDFKSKAEMYSSEYSKCVDDLNKKTQETFSKMMEDAKISQKKLEDDYKKEFDKIILENSQKLEAIQKEASNNVKIIAENLTKQILSSIENLTASDAEIRDRIENVLKG